MRNNDHSVFVNDVTLIVDNDQRAHVETARRVESILRDHGYFVENVCEWTYSEHEYAGLAGLEIRYYLIDRMEAEGITPDSFFGLLIGQFLSEGTDAWAEVGATYLPDPIVTADDEDDDA